MSRPTNALLRDKLASVAASLPPTLRLVQDVTEAVHADLFPGKTFNQAYQMVSYYLRRVDHPRRRHPIRYTSRVLSQLALMPTWARSEYAVKRGVSLASLDAAVRRFVESTQRPPTENKPYVNFSNSADLSKVGLTRKHVTDCREYLDDACGLALRAPNYLYHHLTGRRYTMTTPEQISLLKNPKYFLKLHAEHIKKHWEAVRQDPIDTPEADSVGEIIGGKVLPNKVYEANKALTGRGRRFAAALEAVDGSNVAIPVNSALYGVLTYINNLCAKIIDRAEGDIQ